MVLFEKTCCILKERHFPNHCKKSGNIHVLKISTIKIYTKMWPILSLPFLLKPYVRIIKVMKEQFKPVYSYHSFSNNFFANSML